MPEPADPRPVAIVTACMQADGRPTFALNEVQATPEQIENGLHYYFAEAQLLEDGFEEPFVHFDQAESPAFLHAAVRAHLGLPPAVPEPVLACSEEP
jgi:hypothetical protein